MNKYLLVSARCIGISVLFWNLFWIIRIFLMAYLSPSKTYTMNMDNFGEATVEIWFILLMLPFAVFVLVDYLNKLRKKEVKKR